MRSIALVWLPIGRYVARFASPVARFVGILSAMSIAGADPGPAPDCESCQQELRLIWWRQVRLSFRAHGISGNMWEAGSRALLGQWAPVMEGSLQHGDGPPDHKAATEERT